MEKTSKNRLMAATLLVGFGVLVLGVPLHYLYDALGKVWIAGLIGPVNESAWEHFKLFYWPMLALSCLEHPLLRRPGAAYFLPKLVSILVSFGAMSLFFYVPRAIFGGSLLISIGSFALAVVAAQTVFYFMARRVGRTWSELVGLGLIIALGILFVVWTFVPPHLIPWLDANGGFYGIAGNR